MLHIQGLHGRPMLPQANDPITGCNSINEGEAMVRHFDFPINYWYLKMIMYWIDLDWIVFTCLNYLRYEGMVAAVVRCIIIHAHAEYASSTLTKHSTMYITLPKSVQTQHTWCTEKWLTSYLGHRSDAEDSRSSHAM